MSIPNWNIINVDYILGATSKDGNIIYAYDSNNCYISINVGNSFTSILTLSNITTISTSNDGSKAVIGGTGTHIYHSTNYGNNIVDTNIIGNWYCSCSSNDGEDMIISGNPLDGESNTTYTLTNNEWGLASTGFLINSISFYISNLIKYYLFSSVVYKSIMYAPIDNIINAIPFEGNIPIDWTNACCSSNGQYIYGITYGTSNYIYRSDDFGENFTSVSIESQNWKYIRCSSSGEYVIACNNGGYIYYSVDYGLNFSTTNSTDNWNIASVSDNGQILYSSPSTGIYKSIDGGGITCFSSGTFILSINGNVKIDYLNINDIIKTSEGDKKIIYIGYNYANIRNFKVLKKNKYSKNIPNEDLILSKGHSILVNDDNFINLRKIDYNIEFYKNQIKINELNLLLVDDCILFDDINYDKTIKYFHFVLENNDIQKQYCIYANNMLCESMPEKHINHSNLYKLN